MSRINAGVERRGQAQRLSTVFGIHLDLARRGEIGRIIERWPMTSLTELRDAIDAAIEIVTEPEAPTLARTTRCRAVSLPRGEDKPYRVSFKNPVAPFDQA